jgi:hypothetical protein
MPAGEGPVDGEGVAELPAGRDLVIVYGRDPV